MPLYSFYWDCGRQGELEGIFEASEEEVENLIGKDVYFGEVLGKHSNIHGSIEEGEITLLDADQSFIDKAKEIGVIPVGFNPLDYIN